MTRLSWDVPGERFYETGVDRGVLFATSTGVAWNGLISVQEKTSGGDPTPLYIDGFKYANYVAADDFEATLEAYSAPREFNACDGTLELMSGLSVTQQKRKTFGLSYRTLIGNDFKNNDYGYKIHIVYNALAAPSEKTHQTIGDSADPLTLSWDIQTLPMQVSGARPSAHFIIDSTRTPSATLSGLEDHLYGSSSLTSMLPTPEELVSWFS